METGREKERETGSAWERDVSGEWVSDPHEADAAAKETGRERTEQNRTTSRGQPHEKDRRR